MTGPKCHVSGRKRSVLSHDGVNIRQNHSFRLFNLLCPRRICGSNGFGSINRFRSARDLAAPVTVPGYAPAARRYWATQMLVLRLMDRPSPRISFGGAGSAALMNESVQSRSRSRMIRLYSWPDSVRFGYTKYHLYSRATCLQENLVRKY